MLVVVCYDIADNRRRVRLDRELKNYGERVQRSIFECHLDDKQFFEMAANLAKLIEPAEDRLFCYTFCPKDAGDTEVSGKGKLTSDWDYRVV